MSLVPKLGSVLIEKSSIITHIKTKSGIETETDNHVGKILVTSDPCPEMVDRIKPGTLVMYKKSQGVDIMDEDGTEYLLLSIGSILCYVYDTMNQLRDKQF